MRFNLLYPENIRLHTIHSGNLSQLLLSRIFLLSFVETTIKEKALKGLLRPLWLFLRHVHAKHSGHLICHTWTLSMDWNVYRQKGCVPKAYPPGVSYHCQLASVGDICLKIPEQKLLFCLCGISSVWEPDLSWNWWSWVCDFLKKE